MSDVAKLMGRIDAEFAAVDQQIKDFQSQQVQDFQGRQQRLDLYTQACQKLRETWHPRLEALALKFGDKVKVTTSVSPTGREATFQFRSPLADIALRFSVSTDFEVRHLVLDYNLHILPVLMKFESQARTEFPLESIDSAAIAQWIDDRIVDFVKTYLSLHQNEHYLKGHMVSDPISDTRFPKYAAAATLDWNGNTYYFIGEETRREFEKKNGIST
jgi:YHS domain-containing protein